MSKKTLTKRAVKEQPKKTATSTTKVEPRQFNKQVDVPDPTPEQAKARALAVVVQTHNSRTAIEVRRDGKDVIFIPMVEGGMAFDVQRLSAEAFDRQYKPIIDYPVGRAAKLFVGYMLDHGGTSEALAELEKLVLVTDKEKEMVQAKVSSNKAPERAAKPAKTKTTSPKTAKAKGPSAASRFKELIMAGKLTDEEIFQTVKKEFSLGDDKRTYVSWYRNWLTKNGQNPPAAKGGELKKEKPAAKKGGELKKEKPAAKKGKAA